MHVSLEIAPQFVDENIDDVIGAIQEALLWNFWPRMMADVPPSRKLDVTIELGRREEPVFLGIGGEEVARVDRYHAEYDRGEDKPYSSPLFGERSLFTNA